MKTVFQKHKKPIVAILFSLILLSLAGYVVFCTPLIEHTTQVIVEADDNTLSQEIVAGEAAKTPNTLPLLSPPPQRPLAVEAEEAGLSADEMRHVKANQICIEKNFMAQNTDANLNDLMAECLKETLETLKDQE